MNRPVMVIVAGANGSGKSSNTVQFVKQGYDVIDPDRIARNLSPNAPEKAALSAGKAAINRAKENIQNGVSFSIETTLSSKGVYQRLVDSAKAQNYNVKLAYISTESPHINISRVQERVNNGGHHVPENDIVRRYHRSLENVKSFYDQADEVCFIDNSLSSTEKRIQLYVEQDKVYQMASKNELSSWVEKALSKDVIEKLYDAYDKSRSLGNELVNKYEAQYKAQKQTTDRILTPKKGHER